jgi:hypothetical protein
LHNVSGDDHNTDNDDSNNANTNDATACSRLLCVRERCMFILANWKPGAMCGQHLPWRWHFYAWHRRSVLPNDKIYDHNSDDDNHAGSHDNHRGLSGDMPCCGSTEHCLYERHRVSTEGFLRRVGCMQCVWFQQQHRVEFQSGPMQQCSVHIRDTVYVPVRAEFRLHLYELQSARRRNFRCVGALRELWSQVVPDYRHITTNRRAVQFYRLSRQLPGRRNVYGEFYRFLWTRDECFVHYKNLRRAYPVLQLRGSGCSTANTC